MSAVRAKDTRPELALRKYLHAHGLRYRLHDKRLIGRPDIVFARSKLVVFVDGDFWHGAGWKERGLSSFEEQFPSRRDFWSAKIARNVQRDQEVNTALAVEGWRVIRVFASEITTDLPAVAMRIIKADQSKHFRSQAPRPTLRSVRVRRNRPLTG
jgi:DNA mismatch endonuclease (patch repair protein)